MNKPYTCHVEGCTCTFDLIDDCIQEQFDMGFISYPQKIKVQCHGDGSCNQIYTVNLETMEVVS